MKKSIAARYAALFEKLDVSSEWKDNRRAVFEGKQRPASTYPAGQGSTGYSDEEKALILDIAEAALTSINRLKKRQARINAKAPYIVFAGPPGAGKSTYALRTLAQASGILLSDELWNEPSLNSVIQALAGATNVTYLNTDRVHLGALFNRQREYAQHDHAFYQKWTWAARFISSIVVQHAHEAGIPVMRDATFTTPGAIDEIRTLNSDKSVPITIIVAAPDAVRLASQEKRLTDGYVQIDSKVSAAQSIAAADNLPLLMQHTLEKQGLIYLCVRTELNELPRITAKAQMVAGRPLLDVFDPQGFDTFQAIYPHTASILSTMERRDGDTLKPTLGNELMPFLLPYRLSQRKARPARVLAND